MSPPLSSGTKLGRYEISSKLGAGGMGEVYLARDVTLGRKVALKILPEEAAANAQRMERFVQEAKAASALNHPNILTIHEIGTDPGAHFIATEFIDGDTLRHRMARGPLPIIEALDVAVQVASALATAHAAGIIHRDIKPENIMLREDGIVKVLDFGLAKLTERWRADDVDHDAATRAMVQTAPGVVMGTTAYMSPEQVRGLETDTRTDIWSLAVVLYEMIAGRPPFKGETAGDTSAAILKTEPLTLAEQLGEAPAELERIVRKALEKDREERYQVVKDLLLDLKSLRRELDAGAALQRSGSADHQKQNSAASAQKTVALPVGVSTQASAQTQSLALNSKGLWVWLASLLLIAFLAGVAWYRWRHKEEFSSLAVTQLVSRKDDLGEVGLSHARFSPDGKFVAYASTRGGSGSIWLKQVSGGEPFTSRTELEAVACPLWSPDGQQIAFLSRRESQVGIWTMAAFGSSPILLRPLDNAARRLIAWSKGGRIYFETEGNLYSFDTASQQKTQLTKFDPAKRLDRGFSVSPDEERIAYTDVRDGQIDVWVMTKDGGTPERVTNDKTEDSNPVWAPDSQRILYSSNRNGIKQIFLAHLDRGTPYQLTVNDSDSNVLDVSPDGSKILYETGRNESDLWSVKLDHAKETQLSSEGGLELWPDVSPDGTMLAYQATHATTGAKLLNCLVLARSLTSEAPPTQLAPDGFSARWSPDGKQVAFLRYNDAANNLWVTHSSGGDARPLTTQGITFGGFTLLPYNRSQNEDFQWSADSKRLLYCATAGGVGNVWQIAADGSGVMQLSDNKDANLQFFNPAWSPDGKHVAWLARASAQSGGKPSWSLWLGTDGRGQQLFQSDSVLGLVGWSQSGQELILKSMPGKSGATNVPVEVNLFIVPVTGASDAAGAPLALAKLKTAYFQNIRLAPARDQIAFITRENGADSLEIIPVSGGSAKIILTSNDPRVYFSDLAWAPDGKTIYFGKQSSWSVLSTIDNFK